MDTTPDVGNPRTGVPKHRVEPGRGSINRWLIVAVAALTVAVVALGAALIEESGSNEIEPVPSGEHWATKAATARVDRFLDAPNTDDADAMKPFADRWSQLYTWNNFAGMMELDGTSGWVGDATTPREPVERVSPILQVSKDPGAITVAFLVDASPIGLGSIYIQQWSPEGKITRMWVI